MIYTAVLSTQGYYEPIREGAGKADTSFFWKFEKPGAMNALSREKFNALCYDQAVVDPKKK